MAITTNPVLSAGTLKGENILNLKGEKLGHIEEIMLDISRNRIAYVVLSFGGFLGMGDKLFAVPLEALKPDPKNESFLMDVSKEQLKDAPGFDKSNWPTTADDQFMTTVYSHYRVNPYW